MSAAFFFLRKPPVLKISQRPTRRRPKTGDDGRAIERDECCVINEPLNHKTLTR
jgi:hypothetical protein